MKYAVIDIGSNSVRLMLWADGTLYKKLFTTRLAAGMRDGVLQEDAMRRTAEAIAVFYREGVAEAGAARTFAFATAAVRSAKNGAAFCAYVKELCGAEIDVVSGDTEALLGAYGALGAQDGGMIDIGGASTEIYLRKGGKKAFAVSLPVGVVRLKETCGQEKDLLERAVRKAVAPLAGQRADVPMFAVSGTACTLACIFLQTPFAEGKIHGAKLSRAWVAREAAELCALSVEEKKRLIGMEEKRADVIAGGAVLLAGIMETLKIEEITFSESDNLEGYLRYRGLI